MLDGLLPVNATPRIFDANFSKPKPNFDWADLDKVFAATPPENSITLRDVRDHYKVGPSRAQQIVCEAVQDGILKRVKKGVYVRP